MAKTKTPFLSLGSSGTVGGSLTSQKRGSATILRSKPVPTDPYSLNQAYQRWDYRDYAHLWTLLTNSEKQVYRTKASRYHITGFSQWMRENLKDLPDIMGRWRLDELSGAIAYDSSKQDHNATIIGASPTTGLIAGAYSFDGLNDIIQADNVAANLEGVYSFECFFYTSGIGAAEELASIGRAPWGGFLDFFRLKCNIPLPTLSVANWLGTFKTGAGFQKNIWHHVVIIHNSNTHRWLVYLDGAVYIDAAETKDLLADTASVMMAYWPVLIRYGEIILDNVVLYNRALDSTEAIRKSARRYPA